MAKGHCETCDKLVGIAPTGEQIGNNPLFSARYWRLDMHKCRGPLRELCPASGDKI